STVEVELRHLREQIRAATEVISFRRACHRCLKRIHSQMNETLADRHYRTLVATMGELSRRIDHFIGHTEQTIQSEQGQWYDVKVLNRQTYAHYLDEHLSTFITGLCEAPPSFASPHPTMPLFDFS